MPQRQMPFVYQNELRLADNPPIPVDSAAWFAWLTTATRFAYQPPGHTFRLTLRREQRRHHSYWYAYLRYDRKLHNAYAGRADSLTSARLQQVFATVMTKLARRQQERAA